LRIGTLHRLSILRNAYSWLGVDSMLLSLFERRSQFVDWVPEYMTSKMRRC